MATQNRFGFDVCRYLNTPTMGERLQMMIGAEFELSQWNNKGEKVSGKVVKVHRGKQIEDFSLKTANGEVIPITFIDTYYEGIVRVMCGGLVLVMDCLSKRDYTMVRTA